MIREVYCCANGAKTFKFDSRLKVVEIINQGENSVTFVRLGHQFVCMPKECRAFFFEWFHHLKKIRIKPTTRGKQIEYKLRVEEFQQ